MQKTLKTMLKKIKNVNFSAALIEQFPRLISKRLSLCACRRKLLPPFLHGNQDLRLFHVLRRNIQTLRPIVLRNLNPGTYCQIIP